MKKCFALLILLALLFSCIISAANTESNTENGDANVSFDKLRSALYDAYNAIQRIDTYVEALDDDIARSIAAHWKEVYLDDYRLYLYGRDDPAELPISDTGKHAFVVLGSSLKNGEMTDELKGRCEASAAAAKAFPNSILVCSGGATGENNPLGNTEAGLMEQYLVNQCGIAPERIFTDTEALDTAQNALNTFKILRKQGVKTMTIVTSSYHQRRGQTVYNAMAAKFRQAYGYSVKIVGNYCFDIGSPNFNPKADAWNALSQIKSILDLELTGE